MVEQLKAQNRPQADQHLRVYRPWGYYQGVDIGARYQVKRIVVKPNATLSLQKHFHRAEHWVVVRGTAEIIVGAETRTVHENESVYIPIGSLHRLANPGKIPLELIEVQVGSYLAEDDIVRFGTSTAGIRMFRPVRHSALWHTEPRARPPLCSTWTCRWLVR